MPFDKQRLYVALHARGGAPKMPGLEDTLFMGFKNTRYHWTLILGPKKETTASKGTRLHAKESITVEGSHWKFQEETITLAPDLMLLVRIRIGKVENVDRVLQIARNTPIRSEQLGWNCVGWVQEVFAALAVDKNAMGTSVMDWKIVRDTAMEYCQKKKDAHRFDGMGLSYDQTKVATFDLIEGRETQA